MRRRPQILEEFEEHRDERWRREGTRQVETALDAEQFVEHVGFTACMTDCRRPGPSLYIAVCGRRDAVMPRNVQKDPEASLTWTLKDEVLSRGRTVYYAKLARGKAMFLASRMIPHFHAIWGVRKADEKRRLSRHARAILKVLRREWEMATSDLRDESGVTDRAAFTRAMDELQASMLVVPAEALYVPKFTYIWTLAVGRFPDALTKRLNGKWRCGRSPALSGRGRHDGPRRARAGHRAVAARSRARQPSARRRKLRDDASSGYLSSGDRHGRNLMRWKRLFAVVLAFPVFAVVGFFTLEFLDVRRCDAARIRHSQPDVPAEAAGPVRRGRSRTARRPGRAASSNDYRIEITEGRNPAYPGQRFIGVARNLTEPTWFTTTYHMNFVNVPNDLKVSHHKGEDTLVTLEKTDGVVLLTELK